MATAPWAPPGHRVVVGAHEHWATVALTSPSSQLWSKKIVPTAQMEKSGLPPVIE